MHMCNCVSMEAGKLELQGAANQVWVWRSKFLSSIKQQALLTVEPSLQHDNLMCNAQVRVVAVLFP